MGWDAAAKNELMWAPIGAAAAERVLEAYLDDPQPAEVRMYIARWTRDDDVWRVVFAYRGTAAAMTIPELNGMARGCESGLQRSAADAHARQVPMPRTADALRTVIDCLRYGAMSLALHLTSLQEPQQ